MQMDRRIEVDWQRLIELPKDAQIVEYFDHEVRWRRNLIHRKVLYKNTAWLLCMGYVTSVGGKLGSKLGKRTVINFKSA